jgi:hypothetical protein
VRFQTNFYLKQLLVTGEVSEMSPAEHLAITLRSTSATRVVCEMDRAEFAACASVRIGDSVTIIGWNTKDNPTDSVTLVDCLLWRGD